MLRADILDEWQIYLGGGGRFGRKPPSLPLRFRPRRKLATSVHFFKHMKPRRPREPVSARSWQSYEEIGDCEQSVL